MRTRVDVIMSVFNGRKYVAPAIESILSQQAVNLRFLVIDDGSTDGTADILNDYAKADRRLHVYPEKHSGLTRNLNQLVSRSTATFVARMDADDISAPDRLRSQVNYLLNHPAAVACGCGVVRLSKKGVPQSAWIPPDDSSYLAKLLWSGRNPIAHGSVMFRRAVLSTIPGPYRFRYAQDFDLWLRLIREGEIGIVQEPLYGLRIWNGSISARVQSSRAMQIRYIINVNSGKLEGRCPVDLERGFDLLLQGGKHNSNQLTQRNARIISLVRQSLAGGKTKRARKLLSLLSVRSHPSFRIGGLWAMTFLPPAALRKVLSTWEKVRDPLGRFRLSKEQLAGLRQTWRF
jgi:glycosyltransferase involved in cell wall biosynthesis